MEELEAENAKFSSQLANCRCHEKEDKRDSSAVSCDSSLETSRKSNSGSKKTTKEIVKEKVPEAQMDPTIESEIFKALEKTRLLVGDKKESHYSRCGRTDKGVSAVGQVIALYLRSKLKETCEKNEDSRKMVFKEQYEGEIDYVRVLNRALPDDIRVFGWCPVPLGFNASQAMESAGRKFVGEHDFRNFCKMDALNVHNYRRKVTSFAISPCDVRFDENQLWAIKIKGSAFLWHQVRCMVAVLFLVGQGHESPDVIDALLDTDRIPRKPQYSMAPEIPLVLQSCEFEGLNFTCSSDSGQALRMHLANECQNYHLEAAIFHEALQSCSPIEKGAESNIPHIISNKPYNIFVYLSLTETAFVFSDQRSLDNGTVKKKSSHVPLMSRPTEPTSLCYLEFPLSDPNHSSWEGKLHCNQYAMCRQIQINFPGTDL
ncbi:Pseudouridine synthase family protein [Prunus dulcis]|uniref:tRNA pseudouridine synthase n=1 Tax=Prunus dulcis TaxID=3755 RepID=A0A4Y1RYW7_PRUDU|nr:Pseudouridine synthase family protein [Prunus dulcis]